jgi:hypothetical protein
VKSEQFELQSAQSRRMQTPEHFALSSFHFSLCTEFKVTAIQGQAWGQAPQIADLAESESPPQANRRPAKSAICGA